MNEKHTSFNHFLLRFPMLDFHCEEGWNWEGYTKDPLFREAIFISSPDLYAELLRYEAGKIADDKAIEKLKLALLKYYSRMRTRCTPFGLFSGVSLGKIEAENALQISSQFRRNIRLGTDCLYLLIQKIASEREVRDQLIYFANDSLYICRDLYKYYEIECVNDSFRSNLASVFRSAEIHSILSASRSGINLEQAIEILSEHGMDQAQSSAYFYQLVQAQLLIGELQPCLMDKDPLQVIIDILNKRNIARHITHSIEILKTRLEEIQNIDGCDFNADVTRKYSKIFDLLESIGVCFQKKNVFQIDTTKNLVQCTISKEVTTDVLNAITFWQRCNPSPIRNDDLQSFTNSFLDRYGTAEVNLLLALDHELGINYPEAVDHYSNSLIKDFVIPQKRRRETTEFTKNQMLLFQKIAGCIALKQRELVLAEADFEWDSNDKTALPPVFQTLFELIADADAPYIRLLSYGGSSGAGLMSRFFYTDPKIEKHLREIANKEQELSTTPLAEVVYTPTPVKTANICIRPDIRDYHILCSAVSRKEDPYKLPLSDLTISVKKQQILVKSKKNNMVVTPCLTSAYNYHLSKHPAFRLLCDLQFQSGDACGSTLNVNYNLEYTPRIRYKNVLIALATWRFKRALFADIFANKDSEVRIREFLKWCTKKELPTHLSLSQSDRELYINLKRRDSVQMFLQSIKNKADEDEIQLQEFIFNEEREVLKDLQHKSYRNQFVIAYYAYE